MPLLVRAILLLLAFLVLAGLALQAPRSRRPFGLVIHGGAGNVTPARVAQAGEAAYRKGLERALAAGYAILEQGGASLDAVQAAVMVLEDEPLFNAGVGATCNRDGVHELDAAIMDGKSLAAGAVAGLRHVRNPVALARLVMARTPHALLIGEGAEAFAAAQGLTPVANAYFSTPATLEAYRKLQAGEAPGPEPLTPRDTVGAVALDQQGNLASATSTGGMLNKLPGRVGDSPIIGAGTYADNRTCAVSCTGWGEFFIRTVAAYDVSAQIGYLGTPLAKAAQATLDKGRALGGDGGIIAIDAQGVIAMPFNSAGMFRGYHLSSGPAVVKLFR